MFEAVYNGNGPRISGRGNTEEEALNNARNAYRTHYRENAPNDNNAFDIYQI